MYKKPDWPKIWLLMKNLQFSSKNLDTFPTGPTHELVKWGRFQGFYSKIEDFINGQIFYA